MKKTSEPFKLTLSKDFRELVQELARAGAEFMIVGGFAVAAHGHHRSTKDFDVFVRPTRENAERVLRGLGAFGAPLFGATVDEMANPGLILQIGVPPGRVDIINDIEGVTFDEASTSLTRVEMDGVVLPVIGLGALIRNKTAVARPEDLKDVRILKKLHGLD